MTCDHVARAVVAQRLQVRPSRSRRRTNKMRVLFGLAMTSLLITFIAGSSPLLAQQKTVKACAEEWRANKADNQAKGITEKAYVTQCRAGSAAVQPNAAPAAPTASAPAAPPAPPATTARPAPAAAARPPARPAPAVATASTGANQFTTEAQAKARCSSDTVVWVNLKSKIYHFSGNKGYGNTKQGAYVCEHDTAAQGFRAAKNEKHP
jgi:hypothetical protein